MSPSPYHLTNDVYFSDLKSVAEGEGWKFERKYIAEAGGIIGIFSKKMEIALIQKDTSIKIDTKEVVVEYDDNFMLPIRVLRSLCYRLGLDMSSFGIRI